MKEPDVFVIGGGPAGLATAIAVSRKGFAVTLADGAEPPIDKPCGEGMMPETQAALRDLGVELPRTGGHRFRGIRFVADGAHVEADFPQGQGIGIRRPILHSLLRREAERLGVRFLWRTPIRGIDRDGVHLSDGTLLARWIVGADGSGSRVRHWAGLESAVSREQRSATRRHYRARPWNEYMEIHWGTRAQAYVTPISAEEVCVVIMGENNEDADFSRAIADLPELRERLAGAEMGGRERGAITAMHALRCISAGNVALVGDASGGVDAITGEGLRLAFCQAQALADAIEAGDLKQYERTHRRLAWRPRWMGSLMLQLGKSAWLRGRAMRAMQERPEVFARLLAIHAGQGTSQGVLTAGAQFSWQFLVS